MRISEERGRVRDRLSAMAADDGRWPRDTDHFENAPADFDDARRASTVPRWLQDADEDDYDEADYRSSPRYDLVPERWRGSRWFPNRTATWALAAVAAVAVAIGMFTVWWDSPTVQAVPPLPRAENVTTQHVPTENVSGLASGSPAPAVTAGTGDVEPEVVVVSVVGLVHTPGLVHLSPGSRVADALGAAGGVLDGADTVALNLAQKLADGDQVVVGAPGPAAGSQTSSSTSAGGGSAGVGGDSGTALVNLNSATEEELDALPGVGPVTAGAIVEWRSSNGKFTDIEQLGEVDGIGPARLAKLRTLVSV